MGWQDVDAAGEPTGELLRVGVGFQLRATLDPIRQLHLARWVRADGRWSLHHAMTIPEPAVRQLLLVLRGMPGATLELVP